MAAITPGTPPNPFLDAFRKATSEVLSQVLGAKWSVEARTGAPSAETPVLCFQLSTSGGLHGNAYLQVGKSDALRLAQKLLAKAEDSSAELNQDCIAALQKLFAQIAGLASTALRNPFGDVKIEVSTIEPSASKGVIVALLASEGTSGKLTLQLQLSPEVLKSVSSAKPATPIPNPTTGANPSTATAPQEPNLDLLLGVNLNLTLRFGQRVLPLREIIELNAGAIVELDREVQDPADLLLGDRVIARGQVVIVDGNYGLRITEVTDGRQRFGVPS